MKKMEIIKRRNMDVIPFFSLVVSRNVSHLISFILEALLSSGSMI
jgi:hypothetical protein